MQCPLDQSELVMSERQGVEIDYCPKCRGVWLDRGEIDKIIERSSPNVTNPPPVSTSNHDQDKPYPHHKKKESFLSDLFDF
jgi:Zn-finger nucleic acid-binding protein